MQRIKNQIEKLFEEFLPAGHRPGDINTPLISPGIVKRLAEILNIDVVNEYYQVTNIKTFLKTFMLQCKLEGGVSPDEIQSCLDMINQERKRYKDCTPADPTLASLPDISRVSSSPIYCVECGLVGNRFCVACEDVLCKECSGRIHAKGNRSQHIVNKILPCTMCDTAPSRLQCTYTFKFFCVDCYSKRHVKTIPTAMLDLKPLRIDYTFQRPTGSDIQNKAKLEHELSDSLRENGNACSRARILAIGEIDPAKELESSASFTVPLPAHLSHDWHPFIDSSGVRYFFNFRTEESMRRASPGKMKNAHEEEQKQSKMDKATRKIIFERGPAVLADKLTKEQQAVLDAHGCTS